MLISSIGTAQVTEFESGVVVLKSPRDKTIPLLRIDEPRLGTGSVVLVAKEMCFIRGFATDVAGIKKVEINKVVLSLGTNGQFETQVTLHEGSNPLKVTAEDNEGNLAVRAAEIILDTKGPVIDILQPVQDELRGIRRLGRDNVTVKARVSDEHGVKSVSVNGTGSLLDVDSTFTVTVAAKDEESRAIIVAEDNAGNVSRREVRIPKRWKDIASDFLIGKNLAFIVGIDNYHGAWDKLRNAVRDAKAVEALLRESFRFDSVVTLYNEQATRDNILGKLDDFAGSLGKNDNILIYYSGHGFLQERSQRGYWVPVDADGRSTVRYISHSDLRDRIAAFQVHHLLLVADACFSGELLTRGNPPPLAFVNAPEYLRKVFQPPSRYALTSGGVEPVLDAGSEGHSIFTYYLLKAMREIDDRFFTASQIYEKLRVGVGNNALQMPLYKEIRDVGSESGEFVFVRK